MFDQNTWIITLVYSREDVVHKPDTCTHVDSCIQVLPQLTIQNNISSPVQIEKFVEMLGVKEVFTFHGEERTTCDDEGFQGWMA